MPFFNDASAGYLCLFGGFIMELSIGAVQYSFGNLLPYLASYLASKDKNSPENYNYYIDQGSWIYVARAICFVFGHIFAFKCSHWFGDHLAMLIASIIMAGSMSMTYFTVSSLEGITFTYGIITAFGCGINYMIPLSIVIKWYPNKEAFVSDSNQGFLGNKQVLNNVPSSFWKMALIYFSMQLIALLLIKNTPESYDKNAAVDSEYNKQTDNTSEISMVHTIEKQKQYNKNVENENSNLLDIDSSNTNAKCFNINKYLEKYDLMLLTHPKFWNLWCTLFCTQMTLMFFSGQWKSFTNQQLNIEDDIILSYMGSFSSIANATGRIFWGYINDKSSYIKALSVMTLCDCVLLATWPFLGLMFEEEIMLIIFAYVWLGGIFFFQTGIYNIMVQRVSYYYGIDKVKYYYPILITYQIPSAILSALVVTLMREQLGWTTMSLIMATFQFCAFCFVMLSKHCI
eukprot:133618_1